MQYFYALINVLLANLEYCKPDVITVLLVSQNLASCKYSVSVNASRNNTFLHLDVSEKFS